jgi:hypothetical protein
MDIYCKFSKKINEKIFSICFDNKVEREILVDLFIKGYNTLYNTECGAAEDGITTYERALLLNQYLEVLTKIEKEFDVIIENDEERYVTILLSEEMAIFSTFLCECYIKQISI